MTQENFSTDQLEADQDNLGHKPEGFIDINDVADPVNTAPDHILMDREDDLKTREEYYKYIKMDESKLEDDRKPFASGIEDIDNYVYKPKEYKEDLDLNINDVHELDEKYTKIESMNPGNLDYYQQRYERTTVHKKEKPKGDSNTIRHDFENDDKAA